MEKLAYSPNQFGGVVTDPHNLPSDPHEFKEMLRESVDAWIADGYRLVWLELPLSRAAFVPVAADMGFEYHHAKEDYVMMTLRLTFGAYIPPYATHYIGAGAVVINERDEILVVSERYRMGTSRGPGYKLPGGALHPGEHIAHAAVREVSGGDGRPRQVRVAGLLQALAWIPIRQVRHIFRLQAVRAFDRDHYAGRGDSRVSLDAGR